MEAALHELVAWAATEVPPASPAGAYGWLCAQRLQWSEYRARAARLAPHGECTELAHAVFADLTRLCSLLVPSPGAWVPPRPPRLISPSLLPRLSPPVRAALEHWLALLDARIAPLLHGAQRL